MIQTALVNPLAFYKLPLSVNLIQTTLVNPLAFYKLPLYVGMIQLLIEAIVTK